MPSRPLPDRNDPNVLISRQVYATRYLSISFFDAMEEIGVWMEEDPVSSLFHDQTIFLASSNREALNVAVKWAEAVRTEGWDICMEDPKYLRVVKMEELGVLVRFHPLQFDQLERIKVFFNRDNYGNLTFWRME